MLGTYHIPKNQEVGYYSELRVTQDLPINNKIPLSPKP